MRDISPSVDKTTVLKNGKRYMGSVNALGTPHGSGRKFNAKGSLVYVGEFHHGEPVSEFCFQK